MVGQGRGLLGNGEHVTQAISLHTPHPTGEEDRENHVTHQTVIECVVLCAFIIETGHSRVVLQSIPVRI